MLPASFAACVPVFIATATSACASAGASFVPSPHIATRRPSAWYRRISSSLVSGVASARNSSTPASAAIAAAVSRLSPVTMTVLMPIWRSSAKRSRIPPLTMSRSSITPSTRRPSATDERRRAAARDRVDLLRRPRRPRAALGLDELAHRVRPRPCAGGGPRGRRRSCASAPRTCGTCARRWRGRGRATGTAASPARRSSGPPGSRRRATRAAPRPRVPARFDARAPGRNAVAWRSPSVIVPVLSSSSTSTSPAASTARPEVAITLARTMRSMPAMPIAESRPPMVVGIRQTSSAISTVAVTTEPDAGASQPHSARTARASPSPAGTRAS